jgi:hypothetical protein
MEEFLHREFLIAVIGGNTAIRILSAPVCHVRNMTSRGAADQNGRTHFLSPAGLSGFLPEKMYLCHFPIYELGPLRESRSQCERLEEEIFHPLTFAV